MHRTVRGFSSATDPDVSMVFEVFAFEPEGGANNGRVSVTREAYGQ